jgi:hypothetical protein
MMAMSNRTFIAAIIIFALSILLVAGMQTVKVAKANPIPYLTTPNQDKPTLTIETPQNYTMYNGSSILFNFTVTEPASWNEAHMGIHYVGEIDSVEVYLNGNLSYRPGMYGSENVTNFSIGLNQLAIGFQAINVTILSFTYYEGPAYSNSSIIRDFSDGVPVWKYPIVVSDTVYFTVLEESSPSPSPSTTFTPALSPSLTSPSPTPSPTQSATPSITPTESPTLVPIQSAIPTIVPSFSPDFFPLFLVIAAIALIILAVAILLAFYFRRTKKQKHDD